MPVCGVNLKDLTGTCEGLSSPTFYLGQSSLVLLAEHISLPYRYLVFQAHPAIYFLSVSMALLSPSLV